MIATQPAKPPRAVPAAARSANAGLVSVALRLLLLACAGVVMLLGWVIIWTLSYRLTHGNDFTYTLLVTQDDLWARLRDLLYLADTLVPGLDPGLQGPVSLDIVVNAMVYGFVVLGIGYLGAIMLIDLGVSAVRGALAVILVFDILYQAILFLLPGLYTTDIFSYVMYGHISAAYNLNPYIFPPNYFPSNPLLGWIHPIWHDQPTVYGPLWTAIGWVVARLSAPFDGMVASLPDGQVLQVGLLYQVFVYKLLMNLVQIVNLALVWWLLGRVMGRHPRARLTAFVVFAWNPLMLFDAAGNAHNDALMVTLLLVGLAPLVVSERPTNVGWLIGTFFVGMSALIKYTTGLVWLYFLVPWWRQLASWRGRVLWIPGAAAVVGAVTLLLYIPWLDFPRAFEPILVAAGGKSWMYNNWAPDLIALTIADQWLDPSGLNADVAHELARSWVKSSIRALFFIYLAWELMRLWRSVGNRSRSPLEPVLESSVRTFMVLILFVLTWVLEWYWMWPLALVTFLGWRRVLTKLVVGYTLTALPVFYVHHYWSTNMPGGVVLLYALPPLVIPLVAWAYGRLMPRRAARQKQAVFVGATSE